MRVLIFVLLSTVMFFGFSKEHVVLRGESLESIAASYGLSVDQLSEANPSALSLFYVGLKLIIPEITSSENQPAKTLGNSDHGSVPSFSAINAEIEALGYDLDAEAEFNKKNYKAAAKMYSKALSIDPTPDRYFNRGIAYYNAKKYNEAIRDFRTSLRHNPSDDIKDRIPALIDSAKKLQAQKEQQRGQLVAAIVGAALGATEIALQATQLNSSKQEYSSQGSSASATASYSANSSSSGSTSGGSSKGKDCSTCRGTGKCQTCNGKRTYITSFGDNAACSNCSQGGRPTGKCPWCKGTGKK